MQLTVISGLGQDQAPRPKVLVPRSAADALSAGITQAGFEVIAQPLTCTVALDGPEVKAALRSLAAGTYQWLIITSARTLQVLDQLGLPLEIPATTKVAAVGPTCACALEHRGIHVDLCPASKGSGQALLEEFDRLNLGPTCQYEARILIPGSQISSATLPNGLRERGWEVESVAVYNTRQAASVEPRLLQQWMDGEIAAAVLTSGSVARALLALLGPPPAPTSLVTIGQPSAKVAADLGLTVQAVATEPTVEGIVAALHRALLPDLLA